MAVTANNNSPSLVGFQRTDINDSTILSNNIFPIDYSIGTASYTPKQYYTPFYIKQSPISLNENFQDDYSVLNNFVKYGSCAMFLSVSLQHILDFFPYSIYSDDTRLVYNVLNYSYDGTIDKSTWLIPADSLKVPSNYKISVNADIQNPIFDLGVDYNEFWLESNGVKYQIESIALPNSNASYNYLNITVKGNPFLGGNSSQKYHIKPKEKYYHSFLNKLSGFERYIISKFTKGQWEFSLQAPYQDSEGRIYYAPKTYFLYSTDGYNPDTEGFRFNNSIQGIISLGIDYDQITTDYYFRVLMPDSIKDFSMDDKNNLQNLCRAFGAIFDEYRSVMQSLPNIFRISYDGLSNTIQKFIPEMARLYGFEYNDFITFLDRAVENDSSFYDINYRLWKNLLINSPWMLAAKGTRRPIIFLFEYMGFDECYYVLDEYFYRFEKPLALREDYKSIDPNLEEKPYYDDLSPKALKGAGYHFQSDKYFDVYDSLGYDWDFLVDNKKSTGYSDKYNVNSKWVELAIDPYKAIECEIYKLNLIENECEPDCDFVDFSIVATEDPIIESTPNDNILQYFPLNEDVSGLTFYEYIGRVISERVNSLNRKVLNEYYSLLYFYYAYYYLKNDYTCIEGDTYGPKEAMEYISLIDTSFLRLVREFLPSTAKLISGGLNIRNIAFARNKYAYKKGIDESSLFERENPNYRIDIDKIITDKEFPEIGHIVTDSEPIKGDYTNVCQAVCVPLITQALTKGTEIEIFWDCDSSFNTVGFDVERLIAGDCLDCDFNLIESGDLVPNSQFSNVDAGEWLIIASGLAPTTDRYSDGTQVAGTNYFYRVRAYNACGEEYSSSLYVENVSTFVYDLVEGKVGTQISNINVFYWEITGYNTTPPLGTFLLTSGYLAKMTDGLYYPITYNTLTNSGVLDRTQVGYQQKEVPSKLACGNDICPQIYTSIFRIEDINATIEII